MILGRRLIPGLTKDPDDVAADDSNRFVAVGATGTIVRSGTNVQRPVAEPRSTLRSSVDCSERIATLSTSRGRCGRNRASQHQTVFEVDQRPVTGTSGAMKTRFQAGR